jgi:hypothetical protein
MEFFQLEVMLMNYFYFFQLVFVLSTKFETLPFKLTPLTKNLFSDFLTPNLEIKIIFI